MRTGLAYDHRFTQHQTAPQHPECPSRVSLAWKALQEQPWFETLQLYTPQKIQLQWMKEIHASSYLQRVEKACLGGYPAVDSPDVSICPISFEIARLAAGGALGLADGIMAGEINCGFSLARPPGHHAEYDRAMGFCLLNNVAILARYFQKQHGLERVFIFDWDVHHGNGTQHSFEADPSVFYASIHEFPFYPGTGALEERGQGEGEGTTLNIPLAPGADGAVYRKVVEEVVLPAAEAFAPDVVLISAGFDAHHQDPLGHMLLDEEDFQWMTERMLNLARGCKGRLVSLLEGGYNLQAMPRSVVAHVETLQSWS